MYKPELFPGLSLMRVLLAPFQNFGNTAKRKQKQDSRSTRTHDESSGKASWYKLLLEVRSEVQ